VRALGLMAMVTEQSSLEGWTKITEDALQEWHCDDTDNVETLASTWGMGVVRSVRRFSRNAACLLSDEFDVESEIGKIDIDQTDQQDSLLTSNDEEIDAHASDDKSDDVKIPASSVQAIDNYGVLVLPILPTVLDSREIARIASSFMEIAGLR